MTTRADTSETGTAAVAATDSMPRGVRRALWGILAGVVILAVYLLAVRGPALLVDLATGVAGAFCI